MSLSICEKYGSCSRKTKVNQEGKSCVDGSNKSTTCERKKPGSSNERHAYCDVVDDGDDDSIYTTRCLNIGKDDCVHYCTKYGGSGSEPTRTTSGLRAAECERGADRSCNQPGTCNRSTQNYGICATNSCNNNTATGKYSQPSRPKQMTSFVVKSKTSETSVTSCGGGSKVEVIVSRAPERNCQGKIAAAENGHHFPAKVSSAPKNHEHAEDREAVAVVNSPNVGNETVAQISGSVTPLKENQGVAVTSYITASASIVLPACLRTN